MENKLETQTKLRTPCFVFHESEFINNITNFKAILKQYFDPQGRN